VSQREVKYSSKIVEDTLVQNFGFIPTPSQNYLFRVLARFIVSSKESCVLIIKGYAGTGKTTVMRSLVKSLKGWRLGATLLAPTGRAAKVLGMYSGERASTIHKQIYQRRTSPSGGVYFVASTNTSRNTIFIVDEASMLGWDRSGFNQSNLIEDLFEYVFSQPGCKLILIGDGAQLPPVGALESPALDLKFLRSEFTITPAEVVLNEVMRQTGESGILDLATQIRACIGSEFQLPFKVPQSGDVERISGLELQDVLETEYSLHGEEGVVLISRSNKRCNAFNQEVRHRIFFREGAISTGDYVMAVKNNYFWLDAKSSAGFIANGDIMEVLRIGKEVHRYGFNFRHVTARLVDYPNEEPVDLVIWIDALMEEGPSMDQKAVDKLYRSVREDYMDLPTKEERRIALQKDPYYNAIQVKFAYALTCHKAQGGQWPSVIVDQGFITQDHLDDEFFRWLYTAVTRAVSKVYLLNFSNDILGE
jgi:exodeoxyribonuclease-5